MRAGLKRSAESPEVRSYLREKIQRARWVMAAIEQRQRTMLQLGEELLRFQRNFFLGGDLAPAEKKYFTGKVPRGQRRYLPLAARLTVDSWTPISGYYKSYLQSAESPEVRSYLREKIQRARWVMAALEQAP